MIPLKSWQTITLPFKIGSGRNFLPDANGQQSLRMAFYQRRKDNALVGRVWFGSGIEGPPGHVHGGVSAYVLDEAMGSASWLANYPTVARKIEVHFERMTPIGVDLFIEAKVTRVKAKELIIEARIFASNKKVYSRAIGHFARLSRARVSAFLSLCDVKIDESALIFPRETRRLRDRQ